MAKVVITIDGGAVLSVMADSEDVQVLILDYDTDGVDPKDFKIFEGNAVCAWHGLDEVNPERVKVIEQALFPA